MATLAQIDSFAVGEPVLKQKFRAARLQVAWNVLPEAAGVRRNWAIKVISDYLKDLDKEYLWCLSHANLAAGNNVTDANLIAAVASFVDAWSA